MPTAIPLRVQERAADRARYAAEVPYDDDGEEKIGSFSVYISSGADKREVV